MRNISIGILIGLMIAAPFAFTQTPSETIFIETPLQIGMSKETVLSRLAERGATLAKVDNQETWFIQGKNGKNDDLLGGVAFTDSRLSWASKEWARATDAETAKVARSFFFLVKSLEDRGNKSCLIETLTQASVELDSKQLSIHCGKRTATLYITAYKDERPSVILDEIIK